MPQGIHDPGWLPTMMGSIELPVISDRFSLEVQDSLKASDKIMVCRLSSSNGKKFRGLYMLNFWGVAQPTKTAPPPANQKHPPTLLLKFTLPGVFQTVACGCSSTCIVPWCPPPASVGPLLVQSCRCWNNAGRCLSVNEEANRAKKKAM